MSPFMRLLAELRVHLVRVDGVEPEAFHFTYLPGAPDTAYLWKVWWSSPVGQIVAFTDGTGEGAVRRACEHYEKHAAHG